MYMVLGVTLNILKSQFESIRLLTLSQGHDTFPSKVFTTVSEGLPEAFPEPKHQPISWGFPPQITATCTSKWPETGVVAIR